MPRCQGTQVLGDCGNTAENEQILLLSLLLAAKEINPFGGWMWS